MQCVPASGVRPLPLQVGELGVQLLGRPSLDPACRGLLAALLKCVPLRCTCNTVQTRAIFIKPLIKPPKNPNKTPKKP
jgi:hypothetical protein